MDREKVKEYVRDFTIIIFFWLGIAFVLVIGFMFLEMILKEATGEEAEPDPLVVDELAFDIDRIWDKEAGAVCWLFANGASCMPDGWTELHWAYHGPDPGICEECPPAPRCPEDILIEALTFYAEVIPGLWSTNYWDQVAAKEKLRNDKGQMAINALANCNTGVL